MDTLVLGLVLIGALFIYSSKRRYTKSGYKEITQKSYGEVFFNKGNLGEYRLYSELIKLSTDAKVLPNVYIPKENGETTEIDLLYIAKTGIYVFESKNYGGWIYGTEKRRYWTQTFPNKSKHAFFNPILQNSGHIRALRAYTGLDPDYFHSIIVFGENATIKSEELIQASVPVLKRHQVRKKLAKTFQTRHPLLTTEDILFIYDQLKPCAQVSNEIKQKHIETVQTKQILK